MTLTIAAAGAAVVAVLEVTLWPYLSFAGASPHPVLIGTIVWGSIASFEASLAWAFAGGLMLDVLAPRPLGTTALVLLIVVAIAAAAARALSQIRLRMLAPIVAALPLSLLYSVIVVLVVAGVDRSSPPPDPVPLLLPGAVADVFAVAVVVAAVTLVRSRRDEPERVGW
jgi:rod shape-determining protein MreD